MVFRLWLQLFRQQISCGDFSKKIPTSNSSFFFASPEFSKSSAKFLGLIFDFQHSLLSSSPENFFSILNTPSLTFSSSPNIRLHPPKTPSTSQYPNIWTYNFWSLTKKILRILLVGPCSLKFWICCKFLDSLSRFLQPCEFENVYVHSHSIHDPVQFVGKVQCPKPLPKIFQVSLPNRVRQFFENLLPSIYLSIHEFFMSQFRTSFTSIFFRIWSLISSEMFSKSQDFLSVRT